ncbi:thioredoxin family protein [Flavobacteriaceae bacterium XHP0103]|uniref:protein-disulfide reductase DsbD family protein n=1 Tax=Marixanthotalea marina TaxID=2844359 RepID=UPI002989A396|nr:protein-disulfide reductase DsbD domain-containing protein [Marixanthotalea marina]MBU3820561.1 thioredoxin family protein [Marixanthotalea marina]
MKHYILLAFLFFGLNGFSQILDPVDWSTSVEKISDTEYDLVVTATIEPGWHLYSQNVPEDGPIPTTFTFETSEAFMLIDKTKEDEGHEIDDPVFMMRIKYFEDKAVFKQRVSFKNSPETVKGTVEFMVCDDSRCLPPTEKELVFEFSSQNFNPNSKLLNPVKWSTSFEKISDTEYDLIISADIEKEWHLYSQYTAEGGSLPIEIKKKEGEKAYDDYELVGKAVESDTIKKYNDVFEVVETFFDHKAVLKQRILLNNSDVTKVTLNLTGQVCKEVCIQINEDFTFLLNEEVVSENLNPSDIDNNTSNEFLYGLSNIDLANTNQNCSNDATISPSETNEEKTLWSIFGLGFLGGLLALLTPCVFPMIPLTVSFFTKKSGDNKSAGVSKAILYGFFILAVYLILSIPFHLLDSINPDILNEISTNVALNVIFFLIFVFFAFSFFGYYELTLPASWTDKTTKGENVGGLLGVFFMALTLALVSFSCTGPILGSLLAGSLTADGGAWQLTAGMGGFGLALGLPFALFAMFPNMMNALPKSGGWLNTTKVILGFLELALAFKFLSNADLVQHWGILKIEVFLGLWIVIFAGLALYLLGKIKFPHDSPLQKLSFFRVASGILVLAFVIYLASGFRVNKATNTFTPLTLLSGLAPPVGYSFFLPNDCPNNLDCFKDLKEGVAYAQKVNKPIMLDFTGYACVNCRKMEEHVWSKPKIDKYLRNEYVLISLYVDDKKPLPEDQQVLVNRINGGTRKLENYGHKWAHFQTQFFQTNSQPYYVLLSPDGKEVLNAPVGYTPDEDEYAQFLQCGLDVMNENP